LSEGLGVAFIIAGEVDVKPKLRVQGAQALQVLRIEGWAALTHRVPPTANIDCVPFALQVKQDGSFALKLI
jgi:hypothetical protein